MRARFPPRLPDDTLEGLAVGHSLVAGQEGRAAGVAEALSLEFYRGAQQIDSLEYIRATVAMQAIGRMTVAAMAPYDVVMTPIMAQRQVRIGEIDPLQQRIGLPAGPLEGVL